MSWWILTELRPTACTDLEHVLRGPIHHPADGAVLHLHWAHIQRLFFQVPKHFRLWMERESHVHGTCVDVSISVNVQRLIFFFVLLGQT